MGGKEIGRKGWSDAGQGGREREGEKEGGTEGRSEGRREVENNTFEEAQNNP